jgi:hypothetical protein
MTLQLNQKMTRILSLENTIESLQDKCMNISELEDTITMLQSDARLNETNLLIERESFANLAELWEMACNECDSIRLNNHSNKVNEVVLSRKEEGTVTSPQQSVYHSKQEQFEFTEDPDEDMHAIFRITIDEEMSRRPYSGKKTSIKNTEEDYLESNQTGVNNIEIEQQIENPDQSDMPIDVTSDHVINADAETNISPRNKVDVESNTIDATTSNPPTLTQVCQVYY